MQRVTTAVPPPPPASAGPGSRAGAGAGLGTRLGRAVAIRAGGSPAQLRLAMAVTVLAGLLLSLVGWYSVNRRDDAIGDAAAAARQLVAVQDVRVQIVQADSKASVAYLLGEEQSGPGATYESLIELASVGLIRVAESAGAAGTQRLGAVSTDLSRYVGLVEQARANNRQGFPVGAAYLRQAHEAAERIAAELRSVTEATRVDVNSAMTRAHRASALLALVAVAAVATVAAGAAWLSRRFKRLINVPLTVAGVVSLLVLTVGLTVNGAAMNDADDAVTNGLLPADLVARARVNAFDARSNEALTLIYRGSGAAFEGAWRGSMGAAFGALGEACGQFRVGCEAEAELEAYERAHAEVRGQDDAGAWDEAVALSTSPTGAASVRFAGFDARSAVDDDGAAIAAADLDGSRSALGGLAIAVIVAGLLVAVLGAAGYSQRLAEYR